MRVSREGALFLFCLGWVHGLGGIGRLVGWSMAFVLGGKEASLGEWSGSGRASEEQKPP